MKESDYSSFSELLFLLKNIGKSDDATHEALTVIKYTAITNANIYILLNLYRTLILEDLEYTVKCIRDKFNHHFTEHFSLLMEKLYTSKFANHKKAFLMLCIYHTEYVDANLVTIKKNIIIFLGDSCVEVIKKAVEAMEFFVKSYNTDELFAIIQKLNNSEILSIKKLSIKTLSKFITRGFILMNNNDTAEFNSLIQDQQKVQSMINNYIRSNIHSVRLEIARNCESFGSNSQKLIVDTLIEDQFPPVRRIIASKVSDYKYIFLLKDTDEVVRAEYLKNLIKRLNLVSQKSKEIFLYEKYPKKETMKNDRATGFMHDSKTKVSSVEEDLIIEEVKKLENETSWNVIKEIFQLEGKNFIDISYPILKKLRDIPWRVHLEIIEAVEKSIFDEKICRVMIKLLIKALTKNVAVIRIKASQVLLWIIQNNISNIENNLLEIVKIGDNPKTAVKIVMIPIFLEIVSTEKKVKKVILDRVIEKLKEYKNSQILLLSEAYKECIESRQEEIESESSKEAVTVVVN